MTDGTTSPDMKSIPTPQGNPEPQRSISYTPHHDNVITHIESEHLPNKKNAAPLIPGDDANVVSHYESVTTPEPVKKSNILPFPKKQKDPFEDEIATAAD